MNEEIYTLHGSEALLLLGVAGFELYYFRTRNGTNVSTST